MVLFVRRALPRHSQVQQQLVRYRQVPATISSRRDQCYHAVIGHTVEVWPCRPEHVAEVIERRRERDESDDDDDASLKLAALADDRVDVIQSRRTRSCSCKVK